MAEGSRTLDLKSGGSRLNFYTLPLNAFVLGSSIPLLRFVNSQLVCLPTAGILDKFIFYLQYLLPDLKCPQLGRMC